MSEHGAGRHRRPIHYGVVRGQNSGSSGNVVRVCKKPSKPSLLSKPPSHIGFRLDGFEVAVVHIPSKPPRRWP